MFQPKCTAALAGPDRHVPTSSSWVTAAWHFLAAATFGILVAGYGTGFWG